ncbi:MAG TPA: hypothetical protein DEG71_09525 [Clostridiales bacterium]|nr:hypothetical protein [Clostridiales bacterium]
MKKFLIVCILVLVISLLTGCNQYYDSANAEVFKNVQITKENDWKVRIYNNNLNIVMEANIGICFDKLKENEYYNVYKFGNKYVFVNIEDIK